MTKSLPSDPSPAVSTSALRCGWAARWLVLGAAFVVLGSRGLAQPAAAHGAPIAQMAQTVQLGGKALPVATDVELEAPASPVSVNTEVTFTVRLSDPRPYKKWQVVFGDGSSSEWSTGTTATHTYKNVGLMKVFAIYATFDGERGRPVSQSRTLTLQVDPPNEAAVTPSSVKLTASATHLLVGQSVSFKLALNTGGALPEYTFRSGEPQVQNEQTDAAFVHEYQTPGKYWASVNVHGQGKQLSDAVELTVDEITLGVSASPVEASVGDNVRFTARGPAPDIKNVVYRFDFGDKQYSNWSATPAADHPYRSESVFSAAVELGFAGKNPRAIARSAPVRVTISRVVPPSVSLEMPAEAEMDQDVVFEAKPSNVPRVVLGYRFNFGDGITSDVMRTPAVKYRYSTGGWQNPYVEIGPLSKGPSGLVLERVIATSPNQRLWVKKPVGITLVPAEISTREGDVVTFRVAMSDGSSIDEFKFDPGDGSEALTIKSTQFTHEYPAGQFKAAVTFKKSRAEATVSAGSLTVWEKIKRGWEKTPNWLRWLFIAASVLAVAALINQAIRRLHPVATVKVRNNVPPKFLPGPKPPSILFSLRLNPALNRATCRFSPDAGIIRSEETRHD